LNKAKRVFINGTIHSGDAIENLAAQIDARLPTAIRTANPDTKTEVVARLITQLEIHLGPFQGRGRAKALLLNGREFLKRIEGTEWGEWFLAHLLLLIPQC
jgi:hypothetical protein